MPRSRSRSKRSRPTRRSSPGSFAAPRCRSALCTAPRTRRSRRPSTRSERCPTAAKAGADVIEVSGFEGGTGAASSSSIEHAGLPLERALAETHQSLVLNGVRERVRLRADGGIKTGYDVAAVLALGADEVSLGTALMIAEQCIFCHGCAVGLCPAGITTQNDLVARRLMTVKKGRPKDDALPDLEEERYEDAREAVSRYL